MKISKKFVESIVVTISDAIKKGEKEGIVLGFNFYVDKIPENLFYKFPLNLVVEGEEGTVYIGGK